MGPKMPLGPERIILIHGAWAGGWVWEELAPRLEALGHEVQILELPGNGHHPIPPGDVCQQDYLDALDQAIMDSPGPVTLVGHSGGGMLVTAGAARYPQKVRHGVWIAGMLLPNGESFDQIMAQVGAEGQGVTPHVRPCLEGAASEVPPQAAIEFFFHDLPADKARAAARKLTPQPVAGRRIPVQVGPEFAALPKLYVMALEDRSVLPAAQQAMCAGQEQLEIFHLPGGHVPQITHGAALAEKLHHWLSLA